MSIIEELFNIVAPHICLRCQQEGGLLCRPCQKHLTSIPERCYKCGRWSDVYQTCASCRRSSPLHSVHAATAYEGAAKELLHVLKFARAKAAAQTIADLLSPVRLVAHGEIVITHVPTAQRRVRERGYDQAALIARELSKRTGLPYLPLLIRLGDQRQLGRPRGVRKQQMVDAFRASHALDLQGKHILIVDDVLTTGATCEAAARTLRRAGANRVSAAVFAVA